jgi:hypothetical protein
MIAVILILLLIIFLFKSGGAETINFVPITLPIRKNEPFKREIDKYDSCAGRNIYLGRKLPCYIVDRDIPRILAERRKNINYNFYMANVTKSHFLGCVEFLTKFPVEKCVILGTRLGIVPFALNKLFPDIKFYYFARGNIWNKIKNIKNIKIFNRLPIKKDFKKLKSIPLINLLMIRDDSAVVDEKSNVENAKLLYDLVNYMLKMFKPPCSLNIIKATNKTFKHLLPAGEIKLIPFTFASSFLWLETEGPVKARTVDIENIYKVMMVFLMCIRNENHGAGSEFLTYDQWAEIQILNEYCLAREKNFEKVFDTVQKIFGENFKIRENAGVELSQVKVVWPNRYFNPAPFPKTEAEEIISIFDGSFTYFKEYLSSR